LLTHHHSGRRPDPPAAQYVYWPSGQIRRVVLGNNLQGVDYLYNSRDWLTQINHQNLYYTQDPGGDGGGAGVPNADRFGQIIDYDKQKGLALGHSDFFAQYNGNMIKDVAKLGSGNTISYDYRNLPYKVPTTGGAIDFGYDGKGQRVSKNNLFYVPGADGRVIAVYDDKGTLLYWNIWGLDLIGQRFWKQ
jgi:hypothetical protein